MLQIGILSKENRVHSLPTTIELLRCDPSVMNVTSNEERIIDVAFDPNTNIGCCRGLELRGLLTTTAARRIQSDVTLEKYIFIPHNEECAIDENTKSELEEYFSACLLVAYDIKRKLGESPNKPSFVNVNVQKFLAEDSPKYSIIQILNEIRNCVKSSDDYYPIVEEVINCEFLLK
jgi:hypothetical protein